jgi:molecular chaperone DnaK
VSAKDKATGKENKITIKANSGLTEDEIQRMVKDAEVNAAEDHRRRELADARNQTDALIHSVKKSLAEYGDKIDASEKAEIESKIKAAEEALKSEDKATIESASSALMQASQKLGEKMYADMQAKAGAAGAGAAGAAGAASGAGTAGGGKPSQDDDVVDAEFKEVKRDA